MSAEHNNMDRCENCMFWRAVNDGIGECRRYPPVPVAQGGSLLPLTRPGEWCGEYIWRTAPR